jgi:hypothetical protein
LTPEAQRKKAGEAAIRRLEKEVKEREAAEAEKEAREEEALCSLLGITLQAEMKEQDEREDDELFRMLWAEASGH